MEVNVFEATEFQKALGFPGYFVQKCIIFRVSDSSNMRLVDSIKRHFINTTNREWFGPGHFDSTKRLILLSVILLSEVPCTNNIDICLPICIVFLFAIFI